MPELPEVETTRRGIESLVSNKTISGVTIHNAGLRWPVPDFLPEILPGQRVLAVERRSKYLLFRLDRGTLIIHLGMTGHLRLVSPGAERRKHDHVEIHFDDETTLCYNDPRRFGAMLWTGDDPLQHERLRDLGPEPLGESFTPEYLYERSRRRSVAVKVFLMDAKIVVGVGNIYANEALFRAGISPQRPAGKVSRAGFEKLVVAVKEILTAAIAAGGTTIRDFADTEGRPGYFSQELRVYGRAGMPCVSCHGPIRQVRLGQRSTYFCPSCQV
ncbi:MAG: bifunctional DNA-formamidopyrimidine glycosylase/DNA-(apurinic or apyrimidinic site) lyase [Desulfuromonadales bacterium]|nr:bifunctional DNA-formamidopyrimidine glycosylase/DNA-(apurinic or apyrimidinic site) lyase [Desulfuromonadales bacterium]